MLYNPIMSLINAILAGRYFIPKIRAFEDSFDYLLSFEGLVGDKKVIGFKASEKDLVALKERIEEILDEN